MPDLADLARKAYIATPLRRRVKELEDEVQECRQLSVRLAELTDLVTELLVPLARRDDDALDEVAEKIRRYQASIGGPPSSAS